MSLTPQDFIDGAALLQIEPAALRAVADVESSGTGFLPDGRPKILFEAHIFYQELRRRGINPDPYTRSHSNICSKRWNRRLYKGGAAEYDRLGLAGTINLDAALCSASWGAFQVMGFNYRGAGFPNVGTFVEAMKAGERAHLLAAVNWIAHAGLADELQEKDWYRFALAYNGPGGSSPRRDPREYDDRIAAAYARRVAEGWPTVVPPKPSTGPPPPPPITVLFRQDGQVVSAPAEAVLVDEDGRVFIRIRTLADAMGWSTAYDAAQRIVTVQLPEVTP